MTQHLGMLAARLLVAAPFLYLAALMIIDPSAFAALLARFRQGIQNFEQQLGSGWRFPALRPESFQETARGRGLIRLAGLVLAMYAIVRIAQP